MTLEKQVTNLKLAQKLKELGVKQESLFFWHRVVSKNLDWQVTLGKGFAFEIATDGENISAFTVAELGEIIQKLDPSSEEMTTYMDNLPMPSPYDYLLCPRRNFYP